MQHKVKTVKVLDLKEYLREKREHRDKINNKYRIQRHQLVPNPTTLSAHSMFNQLSYVKTTPEGTLLGDQDLDGDISTLQGEIDVWGLTSGPIDLPGCDKCYCCNTFPNSLDAHSIILPVRLIRDAIIIKQRENFSTLSEIGLNPPIG